MPIPLGILIDVSSSVLSTQSGTLNFNGLFITPSDAIPTATVMQFGTAAEVGAMFTTSSDEYDMATHYFNGFDGSRKKPSKLLFYRKPAASVGAWLRGGSLATMTLTQLQALSGTLILSIDGTPYTTASINLSGAASFSAAAVLIAAALVTSGATGTTCTYSSTYNAFTIYSPTTGAGSTITFSTGTLSTGIKLATGQGGLLSQGAVVTSYTAIMTAIWAITQDWVTFTTVSILSSDEVLETSKWVEDNSLKVAYVPHTVLASAIDTNDSTDILSAISAAGYNGAFPVYGDNIHAAGWCGFAGCLDATVANGWRTTAYMAQSGLAASVTETANAQALIAKGYAFIGDWTSRAMREVFGFVGKNPSVYKWLDAYLGKIWIEDAQATAILPLLGNLPNDATGRSRMLSTLISGVVNPAKDAGIIGNGEGLSQVEKDQIDSIMGLDAYKNVENNGYYILFYPLTADDKSTRTVRGVMCYVAQGFVHFVKINNYISV